MENENRAGWEFLLHQAYKEMSSQERKVANLVLEKGSDILTYSIHSIAEESDVSEATVVRFCHTLGYSGLKEFKIQFFSESPATMRRKSYKTQWGDSDDTIVKNVYLGARNAIDLTFLSLDQQSLTKVADLFAKKLNIDMYGVGGSAPIAQYARHQLQKLGLRVNVYSDIHGQHRTMPQFAEGDLVVAISCSGETKEIIEAMLHAKSAKSIIIAITDKVQSTLGRLADHSLVSFGGPFFCNDVNAYSRLSQLAIIDALFLEVAVRVAKDRDGFQENFAVRTRY
ncbi:MAG: MurR/RpiR family transcriptional regulator [Sphaerochaetaceae bacterium]